MMMFSVAGVVGTSLFSVLNARARLVSVGSAVSFFGLFFFVGGDRPVAQRLSLVNSVPASALSCVPALSFVFLCSAVAEIAEPETFVPSQLSVFGMEQRGICPVVPAQERIHHPGLRLLYIPPCLQDN
jgi:hypothetical protein